VTVPEARTKGRQRIKIRFGRLDYGVPMVKPWHVFVGMCVLFTLAVVFAAALLIVRNTGRDR
jgi:hypothetical protein